MVTNSQDNYLFRKLFKKVRTWLYPQPSKRYYQGLIRVQTTLTVLEMKRFKGELLQ